MPRRIDRLSSLDAAFLHFEHPHTPLHVAGLYLFEGTPEITGRLGLGGLYFGIIGDYDALPDLDVIGDGLRRGFERLELAAVAVSRGSNALDGAPPVVTVLPGKRAAGNGRAAALRAGRARKAR